MRQVEPSFLIQSTFERLAFGTAPGSTSRSSTADGAAVAPRLIAVPVRAEPLRSAVAARISKKIDVLRCGPPGSLPRSVDHQFCELFQNDRQATLANLRDRRDV